MSAGCDLKATITIFQFQDGRVDWTAALERAQLFSGRLGKIGRSRRRERPIRFDFRHLIVFASRILCRSAQARQISERWSFCARSRCLRAALLVVVSIRNFSKSAMIFDQARINLGCGEVRGPTRRPRGHASLSRIRIWTMAWRRLGPRLRSGCPRSLWLFALRHDALDQTPTAGVRPAEGDGPDQTLGRMAGQA